MLEFPQLETARLFLGKISINDIPKIIDYAGNQKIAANTLNIPCLLYTSPSPRDRG